MSVLTDEVRRIFDSGWLAHLVTLNRDGSPQMTAAWVGLGGNEIVGDWVVIRLRRHDHHRAFGQGEIGQDLQEDVRAIGRWIPG